MPYLIGTDEAGYGPNLGPLVVAASVWQVPENTTAAELYTRLKRAVLPALGDAGDRRLAIADSKSLYKPGLGLRHLERGIHTAWALLQRSAATWRAVWPLVSPPSLNWHDIPWHDGYDLELPCDLAADEVPASAEFVGQGCERAGVQLLELQADVVYPARFNDLIDRHGNKAELLSLVTLALAAAQIQQLPPGDVFVSCDKHGGRGKYAALLQHLFPDSLVQVRHEGREESLYHLDCGERRVEFCFLAKGERMLPTALASMLAKYLRELAMLPFNDFWQREVAGLRRTAGYPSDARRFWDEIRPARERLQLADRTLWRCR